MAVPPLGFVAGFLLYFSNNFTVALRTSDAVTAEVLISSLLVLIWADTRNTGWFVSDEGCKEKPPGLGAQSTSALLLETREDCLLVYDCFHHRFDTGPPAYKAASMIMEIKS